MNSDDSVVDSMGSSVVVSTERVLAAIHDREATLHAFVEVLDTGALQQAQALDALPAAQRGPLHGLPLAVKEVFDLEGMRCPLGAPAVHGERRPTATSPLVEGLTRAGAVVVGTTVSTEYAIAAIGPTRHPMNPAHTPGASSSGSAAAVGAGLVPMALGSQTIGSIIRPAAYCGGGGFKPTVGRLPTAHSLCLSPALDHAGLITDHTERLWSVVMALGMHWERLLPRRVHQVSPWFPEEVSPAVTTALSRTLKAFAAVGVDNGTAALPAGIVEHEAKAVDWLLGYDLARQHGWLLEQHGETISPTLRDLLQAGQTVSGGQYQAALALQQTITAMLHDWLAPGEILLAPATVDTAPRFGEGTGSRAPQRLWTLAGMPALTLPVPDAGDLPVGIQLIGRQGEDDRLLGAALLLEQSWRDDRS